MRRWPRTPSTGIALTRGYGDFLFALVIGKRSSSTIIESSWFASIRTHTHTKVPNIGWWFNVIYTQIIANKCRPNVMSCVYGLGCIIIVTAMPAAAYRHVPSRMSPEAFTYIKWTHILFSHIGPMPNWHKSTVTHSPQLPRAVSCKWWMMCRVCVWLGAYQ